MNRLDTLTPSQATSRPASVGRSQPQDGASEHEDWGHSPHINVGRQERFISVAVGAAMVGMGLLRGRLSGLAIAGAGALVVNRGLSGHCTVYERLGVNTAADDEMDPEALYDRGVKILETITVKKPAQELFDYWHDFSNHTRFMPNVESVRDEGGGRSFWRIKGPAGFIWEYEAEIINEEPGKLLAWRSTGGADVQHAGTVRFLQAPGDRGTEVHFNVEYLPPAGFMGRWGAKALRLLGKAPKNDVLEGLRNFKRLMEAGELPTTEGQPRGQNC